MSTAKYVKPQRNSLQGFPNIPDEIFCKILAILGEESFMYLGPFLLASKHSYGLVHELSLLKSCNILPMVTDNHTPEIGLFGKFRAFFIKCVNDGNINAVYHEGLHHSMRVGLDSGIKVLRANFPTHDESNLSLGVFNVSRTRDRSQGSISAVGIQ